jgi:hypothetical protein
METKLDCLPENSSTHPFRTGVNLSKNGHKLMLDVKLVFYLLLHFFSRN